MLVVPTVRFCSLRCRRMDPARYVQDIARVPPRARSDNAQPEKHTLVSKQMLPTGKAVDEIVLTPSISKALVLSGKNVRS